MATNTYYHLIAVGGAYVEDDVISFRIEIGRRGAGDSFDPPNATITLNGQHSFDQLDEVQIAVTRPTKTPYTRFLGWITDVQVGLYETTIIAVSQTYSLLQTKTVDGAAGNSPLLNNTPIQLMEYGDNYATRTGIPNPAIYYRNTANWFSSVTVNTFSWTNGQYSVAEWLDYWIANLPDSRWYIDQTDSVYIENGNWRGDPVNNPKRDLAAAWVEQTITSETLLNDRSGKVRVYAGATPTNEVKSSVYPRFSENLPEYQLNNDAQLATSAAQRQTWADHEQGVNDLTANTRLSAVVVPVQHLSNTDLDYILDRYLISNIVDSTNIAGSLPVPGDLCIAGWAESVDQDGYWSISFWMSYAALTRPPEAWQNVTTTTAWNDVPSAYTWDSMITNWI